MGKRQSDRGDATGAVGSSSNSRNNEEGKASDVGSSSSPSLSMPVSPALTAIIDDALYHAYEAELVPTVSAASQLLSEFIDLKEASALILRDCRWMAGVPFCPLEITGDGKGGLSYKGINVGCIAVTGSASRNVEQNEHASNIEQLAADELSKYSEYNTIQDFANQCYLSANEAIQKLTTDPLAESANVNLEQSIASTERSGEGAESPQSPSSLPAVAFSSPGDVGIGRCFKPQARKNAWETPRLICPDYTWAEDAISTCQRLLKNLTKHRYITLVTSQGWDHYFTENSTRLWPRSRVIPQPTYAPSDEPQPFPSKETTHALQFLVTDLLAKSIPEGLNHFRAATEANAVVSKRLYLVKCEHRGPIRALFESFASLKSAPRESLVKHYLDTYHGGSGDPNDAASSRYRRKNTQDKKSPIQERREALHKQLEAYWKNPDMKEVLQIERCCERLENDMSQMLLPLANIAKEICHSSWKCRIRAVTVDEVDEESGKVKLDTILPWQDVPYMRELLRVSLPWTCHGNFNLSHFFVYFSAQRLDSILCRKPDSDESVGIRPLLLDLQGTPRHKRDPLDSSLEISFYPSTRTADKKTLFGNFGSDTGRDKWFDLEKFLTEVEKLRKLIAMPDTPFLVKERGAGSRSNFVEMVSQLDDIWDSETFRAQYQDWYDMVERQAELVGGDSDNEISLVEHAELIRQTEIELSVAMANKEQLKIVDKSLRGLGQDLTSRYTVMKKIVYDLTCRELNQVISVKAPVLDHIYQDIELPELSLKGVFGDQLEIVGETLPVG